MNAFFFIKLQTPDNSVIRHHKKAFNTVLIAAVKKPLINNNHVL